MTAGAGRGGPADPAARRNVLLATDFSEPGEKALVEAVRFARLYQARLHLVHVAGRHRRGPDARNHAHWDHSPDPAQERLEAIRRDVAEHYPEVLASLVQADKPSRGILEYAARNGVDLIVLGTHGHGPVSELFLGSVAQGVVRNARLPVVVVGYDRQPAPSRNVLAALDFTPAFSTVARAAALHAAAAGGRLGIVHVYESADAGADGERRVLRQLEARVAAAGLPEAPALFVRDGAIATAILRAAEEFDAGLIVIAPTRFGPGHGAPDGGPVARILRRARCPVLVHRERTQGAGRRRAGGKPPAAAGFPAAGTH